MALILLFILSLSLTATEYTVETIPNVRLKNFMNHVSNPDKIITDDDVMKIDQYLNYVEDSLGIQVAVVAVTSIGDNDAREFATNLFKYWGIGHKDKDDGLLIQLVTEPNQRSVVFETGYGIEEILPDAICKRIQQDYMLPDMREGNYSEGMRKGVAAVTRFLEGKVERQNGTGKRSTNDDHNWFLWIFLLFSGGILGLSAYAGYKRFRPRKCPQCGNKTLTYQGEQVIRSATRLSEGLAEDVYRCQTCGYTERRSRRINRLNNSGGGPIIMGGGGGGFTSGGFSGGISGGSWGGGSSGGGGSMSRF